MPRLKIVYWLLLVNIIAGCVNSSVTQRPTSHEQIIQALTGYEGNGDVDAHPTFGRLHADKQIKIFLSDMLCEQQIRCLSKLPIAKNAIETISKKYNQLISHQLLHLSNNQNTSNLMIYLTAEISKHEPTIPYFHYAHYRCPKLSLAPHGCTIWVESDWNNQQIRHFVMHEITNVLGFNDLRAHAVADCIIFDAGALYDTDKYCEFERKLIRFRQLYVPNGLDSHQLSVIINQHWDQAEKV